MLVLLSPAKSLDYESPLLTKKATKPRLLEHSAELVDQLIACPKGVFFLASWRQRARLKSQQLLKQTLEVLDFAGEG